MLLGRHGLVAVCPDEGPCTRAAPMEERDVVPFRVGGHSGRDRVTPAPGGSALARSCVLLALRFLALPLHRRLLVVLAAACFGEDATLLDLLVEAAECALERLVLTNSDFGQSRFTSSGRVCSVRPARDAQRRGAFRWLRANVPREPVGRLAECTRAHSDGQ